MYVFSTQTALMITLQYLIRYETKSNAKLVFTHTKICLFSYLYYTVSWYDKHSHSEKNSVRLFVCICLQTETKFLYMTLLRWVRFLKRKSSLTTSFNHAVTVCSIKTIPQKYDRLKTLETWNSFRGLKYQATIFIFTRNPSLCLNFAT